MKLLPIILELVGIAAIGCGIGIEIAMQATVGFFMISLGSVSVAIGGIVWGKFMRRR